MRPFNSNGNLTLISFSSFLSFYQQQQQQQQKDLLLISTDLKKEGVDRVIRGLPPSAVSSAHLLPPPITRASTFAATGKNSQFTF